MKRILLSLLLLLLMVFNLHAGNGIAHILSKAFRDYNRKNKLQHILSEQQTTVSVKDINWTRLMRAISYKDKAGTGRELERKDFADGPITSTIMYDNDKVAILTIYRDSIGQLVKVEEYETIIRTFHYKHEILYLTEIFDCNGNVIEIDSSVSVSFNENTGNIKLKEDDRVKQQVSNLAFISIKALNTMKVYTTPKHTTKYICIDQISDDRWVCPYNKKRETDCSIEYINLHCEY